MPILCHVSGDELRFELAYLRRLVRRTTRDATLRDDLFDAGLERLALALRRLDRVKAWRSYLRCAMHSGVVDELRRRRTRGTFEVLAGSVLDESDSEDGYASDAERALSRAATTLDPETLLILAESSSECVDGPAVASSVKVAA